MTFDVGSGEEEKLGVYKHPGFWKCMNIRRGWNRLEAIWKGGKVAWKNW